MIYPRNCKKNGAPDLIQEGRALEDNCLDLVSGGVVPGDGGCIPPGGIEAFMNKLHHRPVFPGTTSPFSKFFN